MKYSDMQFSQSFTILTTQEKKKLKGGNNSGPFPDPDDPNEIVIGDTDIL